MCMGCANFHFGVSSLYLVRQIFFGTFLIIINLFFQFLFRISHRNHMLIILLLGLFNFILYVIRHYLSC